MVTGSLIGDWNRPKNISAPAIKVCAVGTLGDEYLGTKGMEFAMEHGHEEEQNKRIKDCTRRQGEFVAMMRWG